GAPAGRCAGGVVGGAAGEQGERGREAHETQGAHGAIVSDAKAGASLVAHGPPRAVGARLGRCDTSTPRSCLRSWPSAPSPCSPRPAAATAAPADLDPTAAAAAAPPAAGPRPPAGRAAWTRRATR